MAEQYKMEQDAKNRETIEELLDCLPEFCQGYIVSTSGNVKPLTQLTYLQRFECFFTWLHDYNPYFGKKTIQEYTIDDLALLKRMDFDEFLKHILDYGALRKTEIEEIRKMGKVILPSKASTRNNYLSALKSLYNYFVDNEFIDSSPVLRIKQKKEDRRVVITMDRDQQNRVLDVIECGSEFMSAREEKNRQVTSTRDKAIYLIALHTGIRVSELVSLDIDDLDMKNHCFTVIRKRGNEDKVYFSDETQMAIEDWLASRDLMMLPDSERALFVSTKGSKIGSRLSVRSVEILVKKYAKLGAPELGDKIFPHRLRATSITTAARETHDLYYAQRLAGHSNVTTTTRYIPDSDEQKEENRNIFEK